jgi:predicted  nucleic acid-binding Zn-ribbon protein
MDQLAKIKVDLEANPNAATEDSLYRMKRLSGVLEWRIKSEFDPRLTKAYKNLKDLDGDIDDLNKQYRAFIRTRQAATQSYEGYTIPIQKLRTQLMEAQVKLKRIMARQGRVLEQMAINELDRRRKRLEEYQIKARFALAESYDRATKQQEKKLLEQAAAASNASTEEKAAP